MRSIDVLLCPSELTRSSLSAKTAVVIDALRATSTIATALATGCRAIYPVNSEEDALAMFALNPQLVLAGERGGVKIPGFHMGNSPSECTPALLLNREMVLTTSNGTPLLLACGEAAEVMTVSFLNRAAISDHCLQTEGDIVIICAGQNGRVSLEDTLCAGALTDSLISASQQWKLSDAALLARSAFLEHSRHLADSLLRSQAGRRLVSIGYSGDIARCAELDLLPVVPMFASGRITTIARMH